MAQTAPAPHSPAEVPKRPKGILKNSNSYQNTSPDARVSPTSERQQPQYDIPAAASPAAPEQQRPGMPTRELSEKEIVQMNTELNAGGTRRNSSNPRGSVSRRQSSQSGPSGDGEQSMRLKWDEANLYLNEGQMGGKMKIDEPKTPFVHQYDPTTEDEEETSAINPEDLAVDELEMDKTKVKKAPKKSREEEIPDIDIGEPELETSKLARRESDGERKVIVEDDGMDVDGEAGRHHGEEEGMTTDELEKHRKFEDMRKKHYEMKNVKNLLGHSEDLADDEDEEMRR